MTRAVLCAPACGADALQTLVVRFELRAGDRFADHLHAYHQLSWSPNGLLTARCGERRWSLPATVGIWLPAGTPHEVAADRQSDLHNVYVRVPDCPIDWAEPTVVRITPLLAALVKRLADLRLTLAERGRVEAVLFDNLFPLHTPGDHTTGHSVPLPIDPRAREVAEGLLANPADNRTLDEWGNAVGASRSTLARLFIQETALTFALWRTQVRVLTAIDQLVAGRQVQTVARSVGYQDTSSFIATFRRLTGRFPSQMRDGGPR